MKGDVKMDNLKMTQYILKCAQFQEDPENAGLFDDISNFCDTLEIREYIPLKEKELIVMEILSYLNSDYDAPGAAAFLEMGKTNIALLRYCVNLENDLDFNFLMNLHLTTDLIMQFGLYDAIIQTAGEDYKRLCVMIDNAVSVSNFYRLTQTAQLFDEKAYENWKKSIEDLKDTVSSKEVQDLINLVDQDGQEGKEIVDQVRQMAVNHVNEEIKNEETKFRNAVDFMEEKQEETAKAESGDINE